VEDAKKNIPKYISKKQEYERMLERKKRAARAMSERSDSDIGGSEMEDIQENTPKIMSKKKEYQKMIKRVESLPNGNGKPPSDDPRDHISVLGLFHSIDEPYKEPWRSKTNTSFQIYLPTPAISSNPTTLELMSKYNRQYSVSFNAPEQRGGVFIRRQGTPYSYLTSKGLRPPPIIHEFERLNALDTCAAVASARTPLDIATAIRNNIDNLSPAQKAKITQKLEWNPANFFHEIGIHNVLERKVTSANNNAGPATAQSNSDTPLGGSASELIPIFKVLLAISNLNSSLLKSHFNGYKSERPSPSIYPQLTVGPMPLRYTTPINPDYNVDYVFGKMTENIGNFDEDMAVTVKEEESVGGDFVDVKVEPGEPMESVIQV
jgi:hypothetical protein